jgi:hypothetical protein
MYYTIGGKLALSGGKMIQSTSYVRNELLLYLNAGNTDSYPGTGMI